MNFSIIYDICGETTIPINFPNRYLGTQVASQPLSGDASNSGVAAQDVRQKIRLEDPSGDDQISQQPIYIYTSYIFHISFIYLSYCVYTYVYIYIYISIYKAYVIRGVFIYRDTWFKTGKISRSRFGEKTMVDAFEERTGN